MKIQHLSGRGFLNGEKDIKNKGADLMKDRQGRYTDAVDDVLIKFTKARKKKMTVQYI